MAIQVRRGNKTKFDARKLSPGEWAVALDTKEIYLCFAAGDVRRMATYEEMEENINAATEDVQAAFTAEVREAIKAATQASGNAAQQASEARAAATTASTAAVNANEAAEEARQYILGDISGKTVSFTQATSRVEILSGESLATITGKIKKWFADLASVAFTGSYNSLSNRPTLGTAASRGVANNLSTTSTTLVLDARQGKALGDRLTSAEGSITEANTSLANYSPLRDQTVLYSGQFYADVVNTVKYTTVSGLSAYKMVLMHCEVGDAYAGALVFTPQEIQQKVGAITATTYFGRASFYCDFAYNRIGVQVHNKPDGWNMTAFRITKVYGILK